MNATQFNRAYGAMLGICIGDSLGAQVEFSPAATIRKEFPFGVREMTGGGPHKIIPGQVTDDGELAMSLARAIIAAGGYDPETTARAYVAWKQSGPFDIGMTTSNALGGFNPVEGVSKSVRLGEYLRRNAYSKRQSEANGSLMRITPLGVYGWNLPPAELARLARIDSAFTHMSEFCQDLCEVYTFAIASAIKHCEPGPVISRRAFVYAKLKGYERVMDVIESARSSLPRSADGPDQGWARIAFQCAFFHLNNTYDDFEQSMVETIDLGGDTDTNAAIVGGLIGSVAGAASIPERWKRTTLTCETNRGETFQTRDLFELTEKIVALTDR